MFRRPPRESEEARRERIARQGLTVMPRRHAVMDGTVTGRPLRKECVVSSPTYEAAVRDLGYCMRCGRVCRPQFCHADQGKGLGIKTDVRRGWPGCGPGPWGPGCHYIVGTSGQMTKQERRAEEERLGADTRRALRAKGAWPRNVPPWEEQ